MRETSSNPRSGFLNRPCRTVRTLWLFRDRKAGPNDVDIVMMMDDDFDVSALKGEVALLFDHVVAQTVFGASVFWVRRFAALGGEEEFIARWQTKRDGGLRGIVEVRP